MVNSWKRKLGFGIMTMLDVYLVVYLPWLILNHIPELLDGVLISLILTHYIWVTWQWSFTRYKSGEPLLGSIKMELKNGND